MQRDSLLGSGDETFTVYELYLSSPHHKLGYGPWTVHQPLPSSFVIVIKVIIFIIFVGLIQTALGFQPQNE